MAVQYTEMLHDAFVTNKALMNELKEKYLKISLTERPFIFVKQNSQQSDTLTYSAINKPTDILEGSPAIEEITRRMALVQPNTIVLAFAKVFGNRGQVHIYCCNHSMTDPNAPHEIHKRFD
jgi:hypothetical protein